MASSKVQLPDELDRERHVKLSGRAHHVWQRRVALTVVAVVPVLALLNVFGQRSGPTTVTSAKAALTVDSPTRVRGGLVFTSRFVITASQPIHDAKLLLSSEWFAGMMLNGISPQPSKETADGPWQVYDFGPIAIGQPFPIYISWQANPTNVGIHAEEIAVDDGTQRLLTIKRTFTVFP